MAGISQLVDERIELMRKERAELDLLRTELEKRETEFDLRQRGENDDLLPLEDRKAALLKEIEEAQAEAKRLRDERYAVIENFGDEMDSINAEKNSENAAQTRNLQSEIAFLLKGRTQLEEEMETLRREVTDLEEKRERNQLRIMEEKEAHMSRTRAENDAMKQEAALKHTVTMAELDRERKTLELEIDALEQNKAIEWNKAQAEISRYKTAQFTELDAQKEILLAEAEKEKAAVLGALREDEKRTQAEIAQRKREWEAEELALHAQKQQILDDIKLASYEYEKAKSENTVKIEKARVDELKTLETLRVESLARLEEEQGVLLEEINRKAAAMRAKIIEDEKAAQLALAELEAKKSQIMGDIELMEARYKQLEKSNETNVEALKIERMQEIDDLRLQKLQQVEELRQQRVAELEQVYLDKVTELEAARDEKLEACIRAIDAAEAELGEVKNTRIELEREVVNLRRESTKINEENRAAAKTAMVERELEIERLKSEKMAELDAICEVRLLRVGEKEKALEARVEATDLELAQKAADAAEVISGLKRQAEALTAEFEKQKNEQLAEAEKNKVQIKDELAKLNLARMQEIDKQMDTYKAERMNAIQSDFNMLTSAGYKNRDELAILNDAYNKRMEEMQQLSLDIATDRRTLEDKKQRAKEEIEKHKNRLKLEIETHKKEMHLLVAAKDVQIATLKRQIKELKSDNPKPQNIAEHITIEDEAELDALINDVLAQDAADETQGATQ